MMGSPFYYDVLFDDGPGDVVFHDCMWSGICTCCMQLLHQDSIYYTTNESPDLKLDLSYQQQQQHHQLQHQQQQQQQLQPQQNQQQQQQQPQNHQQQHHHNQSQQHQQQQQQLTTTNLSNNNSSSCLTKESYLHLNDQHDNSSSNINTSPSPDKPTPSSINQSISPNAASSSSTSTSPDTASSLSNSTSPKPVRRREHNDSERKRRDHLRNAFNFLRDQVPRFKAISKKPPRIQILHEATMYVQRIMKDSQEFERRLEEERAKHERLQNLQNV